MNKYLEIIGMAGKGALVGVVTGSKVVTERGSLPRFRCRRGVLKARLGGFGATDDPVFA